MMTPDAYNDDSNSANININEQAQQQPQQQEILVQPSTSNQANNLLLTKLKRKNTDDDEEDDVEHTSRFSKTIRRISTKFVII
jgi:hypothetical protein